MYKCSNYVIHNIRRNNSLGSCLIKYSRLYSSLSKAMNKTISSKQRIFISLVGLSRSGKSHIISDCLKIVTFQTAFDNLFCFYQHYQPLYNQRQTKILEYILGVDFDLIESVPKCETKYLLMFDDSFEEVSNSKQFVKIATTGRHRGMNTIYSKHYSFHQSKKKEM